MSDHEDILSFRRFERVHAKATPTGGSKPRSEPNAPAAPGQIAEPEPTVLPLTTPSGPQPFAWHDLRDEQPLSPVEIRLGRTRLPACDVNPPVVGAIVVLDRTIDEPVEIVVKGEVIGLGRLVVAQNKLAIQVCQVKRSRRTKTA